MLDDAIKTQLKAYLERVSQPFDIVASLDGSESAQEMRALLETIASHLAGAIEGLRADALERETAVAEERGLILADTPSGRLHKALTEKQLAAAVFSFSEGLADPGFLMLGAQLGGGTNIGAALAHAAGQLGAPRRQDRAYRLGRPVPHARSRHPG